MHEMTRDLWAIAKTKGCTAEDFDRYLTASLTKKAEELEKEVTFRTNDPFIGVTVSIPNTRKILGLEVKEDKPYMRMSPHSTKPSPAVKEWPCEHMKSMRYDTSDWKVCPKCLIPRPKEPKKELWELMRDAWSKKLGGEPTTYSSSVFKDEADAAINWMLEMIENKTPTYSFTEREGIYIDKDELKLNLKESAK